MNVFGISSAAFLKAFLLPEYQYSCRLSEVKFDETNLHRELSHFRFVARVSSNEDHQCQPSISKDHQSFQRTALLDSNVFNKFT